MIAQPAVVAALYRAGLTGGEIARIVGVSRERVRQIVKRDLGTSLSRHLGITCGICSIRTANPKQHRAEAEHRARVEARKVERFWARVEKGPSCWLWTGSINSVTGYPTVGILRSLGSGGYAHRVSYILAWGRIPRGLTIDHLCRVRACVNPAHLEAVTSRENTLRSPVTLAALNARKTHCPKGHPYSGANLYLSRDGRARSCRACRRKAAA
jgi:hypothetical protein